MLEKFPRYMRFIILVVFYEVLFYTSMRVAFFIAFKDYGQDYTFLDVLYSFWLGFRFDLQLALIVNLPLLFLGGIKYIGFFKSKFSKFLWVGYIFLSNLFIATIYIIDFAYFDFFKKMVDSSIIRYFYDISQAMQMLQEGYPLVSTTLATLFVAGVFLYLLLGFYKRFERSNEVYFQTKKRKVAAYALFAIVYIFLGYGKLELYPWRWSEAFYSPNTFLSYLASNPVTYFFNTLKNTDEKYNVESARKYYDKVAEFLEVKHKDKEKLNLVRIEKANHTEDLAFKKPNIVFVLGESTSYARSSLSGNPLNPTPHIAKMAQEGISFTRYYTPHAGTARSVWTAMTGFTDVERMRTSSRNPMVVNQHIILNSLKDYKKFYFIGGSLSWGNVRGVIGNVEGIETYEEQDYKNSPHNDVWGISDAHLVGEVNEVLKKTQEPFFAFVQFSGNHSPNTIPEENFGFVYPKKYSQKELMDYSFDGKYDELVGQSFLDFSMGRFIELAKKEEYFDNTIFIFVGDHGLPKKALHMHQAEQRFQTATLHTPFVIYAPKLIKQHKEIQYPVSEVDIMATIAGLTSETYVNSAFGRDVLDKDFDTKPHYAFYMTHDENPQINLIGEKYIYRVRADGSQKRLFEYYFKDSPKNLVEKLPQKAQEMEELCRGIYENTRYLRFHNSEEYVQKRLEELENNATKVPEQE